MDTGNKEVDYKKSDTHHFQIRFDVRDDHNTVISRYFAVVAFQRHVFTKSNLSKVAILVTPAFSIRNWMPFPISILLGGETKMEIAEGRDLPLMESNTCPTLFVIFETHSINGKTFYQSEQFKIPTSTEDREDIQYWKFQRRPENCKTSECFLKRKIVWSQGQVQLQLFSPYWILNSTGLPLDYRTVGALGKDEERILHLETDPFVILPTKREEITVRCLKSGPSEKTPIHTVGHQGTIVCPPSSGDRQRYQIGLSVTAASFGLTSIVQITPFYYLVNRTDDFLEICEIQANGPRRGKQYWIEVKPNSKEPFWPQDSNDSLLIVRRSRSSMESPPIDYGNTEQGILLFTGDVSGIFAEITHNDNACLISFSPYFAGAAAFELVNTTGFPIRFKQDGTDHWSELQSCHSSLYCWTTPLKSRELLVEVDESDSNSIYSNSPKTSTSRKSASLSKPGSEITLSVFTLVFFSQQKPSHFCFSDEQFRLSMHFLATTLNLAYFLFLRYNSEQF